MENKTIIVNLFGGPGSSKSTTAVGIFHELKILGINSEYVSEYAKDITWQENFNTLNNQIYVHGKQHNRIFHLKGKVDVIITDSPAIMGLVYCDMSKISKHFEPFVVDEFNKDDAINMNFYIQRAKAYNPKGRSQTEEQAKALDEQIKGLLNKHEISHELVIGDKTAVSNILQKILKKLG